MRAQQSTQFEHFDCARLYAKYKRVSKFTFENLAHRRDYLLSIIVLLEKVHDMIEIIDPEMDRINEKDVIRYVYGCRLPKM